MAPSYCYVFSILLKLKVPFQSGFCIWFFQFSAVLSSTILSTQYPKQNHMLLAMSCKQNIFQKVVNNYCMPHEVSSVKINEKEMIINILVQLALNFAFKTIFLFRYFACLWESQKWASSLKHLQNSSIWLYNSFLFILRSNKIQVFKILGFFLKMFSMLS